MIRVGGSVNRSSQCGQAPQCDPRQVAKYGRLPDSNGHVAAFGFDPTAEGAGRLTRYAVRISGRFVWRGALGASRPPGRFQLITRDLQ
jgi:hypothetical protein